MRTNARVSAVLIAAGGSAHMGRSKLTLPLGDSTVIEQTLDNVLGADVAEVVLVVGSAVDPILKLIGDRAVRVVVNPDSRQGLSRSRAPGVAAASRQSDAVMVLLADQPFIDYATLDRLIQAFRAQNKGIVVPVFRGKRGHPVIFSTWYQEILIGQVGDVGGRHLLVSYSEDVLEVEADSEAIFLDIDTEADYRALKHREIRTKGR